MRLLRLVALLCAAARLHAQGSFAGIAVDSASGAALPCVGVALEDTAGHAVARQLTAPDGVFQFPSPERGVYRLRFSIWGGAPILTTAEALDPTSERTRRYALAFGVAPAGAVRQAPDSAADAPPWAHSPVVGPHYPPDLRDRGVNGGAAAQYLVDASGRVEQASIRILGSTAPAFGDAVLEYLHRARLVPARFDRQPACALMRAAFVFEVVR